VTRGIRNLTHRDSHAEPTPLEPGQPVTVTIGLDATSWIWEPGHRVRLAIAGSDFPSSWPPPDGGTIAVQRGASSLVLPVIDGPPIAEPPVFAPGESDAHHPDHVVWEVTDDVVARRRRVHIDHGGVRGSGAQGLEYYDHYGGEIVTSIDDPGDTHATGGTVYELAWPEVAVRTESKGTLRSDATTWHLDLELEVQENGETIARRSWTRTVPRDLA